MYLSSSHQETPHAMQVTSLVHPITVVAGRRYRWAVVVQDQMTIELSVYFKASDESATPRERRVVDQMHVERCDPRRRAPFPSCARRRPLNAAAPPQVHGGVHLR